MLFTSDLEGALVEVPCQGQGRRALLPQVAAAVETARDEAERRGDLDPVVIDASDGLFPSALVGHLTSAEGGQAGALATGLSSAGYDAIALGDASVAAPARFVIPLMRALGEAGAPAVVSNASCGEEADQAACRAGVVGVTRRAVTLDRGAVQVGVVNALAEGLAQSIPPRFRGGATLTVPAEAMSERITLLRNDGADLVVLISNLDDAHTAPRRTLELLEALDGEAVPDLVIAASTAGIVSTMQAPGDGPPIVTASPGTLGRALIRREGDRWTLVEGGTRPLSSSDEALATTVSGWNQDFCQRYDRALTGGELAVELDQAAFAQMVLRAMREQTNAEIAVINRRAISSSVDFPLEGRLTAARVHRALPIRSELRVATVRGSNVGSVIGAVLDSERAHIAGVERRDGSIYINGREINPDGRYQLVTTAFVAGGGEGIVDASAVEFEEVEPEAGLESSALPDRVIHWLDSQRGATPYDPSESLNLHREPLWYGGVTLDATVTYTSITDDNVIVGDDGSTSRRYNQTQLSRQGVLDLRGTLEARGGLSVRGHGWDNVLRLQYGRQRLETEVGSDVFEWAESVDLIQFRSAYDMDYLRDVVLDGAWYGPSIFLEYQLESEFFHEIEDDSSHFLEMTGLLGVKFKPLNWFRFSVAAGIRSVVLAPDPFPVPGLNLRAEIVRRRFSVTPNFPIYVSAIAEYFVGWPVAIPDTGLNLPAEDSAIHKFSTELRLEITLYGPLRLTGSVRGFIYDEDPGTVATAFDATAGLSVSLSGHRQTF